MSLRICTIGCGNSAMNHYGPSDAKCAATCPSTDLAACRDVDDLVVPEPPTREISCTILDMGYPLLMEDPVGRTIEETERMLAAANASGAVTQVAFNRRHAALVRELISGVVVERATVCAHDDTF